MTKKMQKEDIIILGRGGHAKVVIDMIEEGGFYNIIGVTDVKQNDDTDFFGYPILGNDDVLPDFFKKGVRNAAIGIGGFTDNNLRKKIFNLAKSVGFNLPPIIHSSAIISKRATIGEGTIVKRGVIIDTDVTIGVNNILEIGAIVGHESRVGNHTLLSANVMISAYNLIDDESFFAVASTIVSGAKVCTGAIIGAGAVVVNDITEPGLYLGVPAKKRQEQK